jgi:hypothetical protein
VAPRKGWLFKATSNSKTVHTAVSDPKAHYPTAPTAPTMHRPPQAARFPVASYNARCALHAVDLQCTPGQFALVRHTSAAHCSMLSCVARRSAVLQHQCCHCTNSLSRQTVGSSPLLPQPQYARLGSARLGSARLGSAQLSGHRTTRTANWR